MDTQELIKVVESVFGNNYMINKDVLVLPNGFIGMTITMQMSIALKSNKDIFHEYLKNCVAANNTYCWQLERDKCNLSSTISSDSNWFLLEAQKRGTIDRGDQEWPPTIRRLLEFKLLKHGESTDYVEISETGEEYLEISKLKV